MVLKISLLFGHLHVLLDLPAGWTQTLIMISNSGLHLTITLFGRRFLSTRLNTPRLDKGLIALMFVSPAAAIIGLSGANYAANLVSNTFYNNMEVSLRIEEKLA